MRLYIWRQFKIMHVSEKTVYLCGINQILIGHVLEFQHKAVIGVTTADPATFDSTTVLSEGVKRGCCMFFFFFFTE